MKKIILLFIILLPFGDSYSQTISAWQQYPSGNNQVFDFNTHIAIVKSEEIVLLDKVSLSIHSQLFPAEFRNVNSQNNVQNNTRYGHEVTFGPNGSFILKGGRVKNQYQFNGQDWRVIDKYNGQNIDEIRFVKSNQHCNVYWKNSDTSLNIERENSIKKFTYGNSPLRNNLKHIHCTEDGNVMISDFYSVDFYNGSRWISFDTSDMNVNYLSISSMASDMENNFCFESNGTLWIFNPKTEHLKNVIIPDYLIHQNSPSNYNSMTYDSQGNLWFSSTGILFKYDGSTFKDYYGFSKFGKQPILYNVNYSGHVTFRTAEEDYFYFNVQNSSFNDLPIKNKPNLRAGNVKSALKDKQGNLWFSQANALREQLQEASVFKKKKDKWQEIKLPIWVQDIYSIRQDKDESVLVGGNFFFSSGEDQIIRITDSVASLLDSNLTSQINVNGLIGIDSKNHYWFSGRHDSIFNSYFFLAEYYENQLIKHPNPFSLNLPVQHVYVDSDDNKWVHQIQRLCTFSNGHWTDFTSANSLYDHRRVFHITEEPGTNILWFSTETGFLKYDHGTWSKFDNSNSPIPSRVGNCVFFDSEGRQWFGTRNGVAVKKDSSWEVYTTENSKLRNNDVQCIVEDDDCNVWLGTEYGLNKCILNCEKNERKIFQGTVYDPNRVPKPFTDVFVSAINKQGNDVDILANQKTDSNGNFSFYLDENNTYYFSAKPNSYQENDLLTMYASNNLTIQQTNGIKIGSQQNKEITINQEQGINRKGDLLLHGSIDSRTERHSHIRVILMQDNNAIQQTMTDMNGAFDFRNLIEGNYDIWIDKPNLNNAIAPTVYLHQKEETFEFELFSNRLTMPNREDHFISGNSVFAYPNPFQNNINFKIKAAADMIIQVRIYDIGGRIIYYEDDRLLYGLNQIKLQTNDFPPGAYFYRLNFDGKNYIGKLIK